MADEDTFVDPEKPTEADKAELQVEIEDKAPAKVEADKPEVEDKPADEKPRDEKGKFVPLQAVHEARKQAQEAKAETERLREEQRKRDAAWEKRFNDLANPPKPAPDPRQDLKGYLDHQLEPVLKVVQETTKEREERQERERASAQHNEFAHNVISREREFAKTTPDYETAAEHWKQERVKELIENGTDEDEAVRVMNGELLWSAEKALKSGKNPAEVLYNRAKRLGYKPAEVKDTKGDDQFDTLERASKASRSLGAASGSAPNKRSAAQLADMSDDEYAALRAKHSRDEILRMFSA